MEIDNHLWYSSSHKSIYDKSENGMVKYNHHTNEITEIIPYSEDITPCRHFCCHHKDQIYIIDGENEEIILFDPNSKTYTKKLNIPQLGRYPSAVVAFDKIHIFHGDKNTNHLIYDIASNTIITQEDASVANERRMFGVSILKYQNRIIKFGGYCWYFVDTFMISNELHPDDTEKALEWTELIKLPRAVEMCGYVLFRHYIIIFGGEGTAIQGDKFMDTIYIFDLNKRIQGWKLVKHIKCPIRSKYCAIIDSDNMVHLFTEINRFDNWRKSEYGYYSIPIASIFGDKYHLED